MMTAETAQRIQRHIGAKVADEDFRQRLEQSQAMNNFPVVQVMVRMICMQLGIDDDSQAQRLGAACFSLGHTFGRDLGKVDGMEFPAT